MTIIKHFTIVAVKCLIMVVEQKFKVLWKAEKEIYQNMNSNVHKIEKNSAECRDFAEILMPVIS